MTIAMQGSSITPDLREQVGRQFRRKRMLAFGVPLMILAYFAYTFFAFDIPGLAKNFRWQNTALLLQDSWSYKTQVELSRRSGKTTVAIEGERRWAYDRSRWPAWVHPLSDADTRVDLPKGSVVEMTPAKTVIDVVGFGPVSVTQGDHGLEWTLPAGKDMPGWISASDARVDVRAPDGSLSVTRTRTAVFRFSPGWEMFFFDLNSPFYWMSWGERFSALFSADQVVPGMSNAHAMLHDFWLNEKWHHGKVYWALFETLLMAFLGTFGAALIAGIIAVVAARNFNRDPFSRFGIRRIFDFLRGVDGLIWTIVLSRAFGPGPMTGALAILLTDIGSFGKLFSESLENIDEKQVDGLRSTGAGMLQRNRFGVMPQVSPVIVSQVLYFFESNTRSATVIGAIVGGGIGLLLTQAMITQNDWEAVSYFILLILLLVMAMDALSGWIRRRLIDG